MLSLAVIALLVTTPPEKLQLARGQELTYRGQCIDAITGESAGPRHTFELLTRLFALEAGGETAVATNVTDATGNSATKFSVFIAGKATRIALPLLGPATWDPITILDFPNRQIDVGASWSVADNRRPPRRWTVEARESPPDGGVQCWKLRGQQQSHNWEMSDENKAWRRDEVVWLDTRTGIVHRLERVLVVRDPAQPNMLRRIVTCHRLESNMTYPGQLEADVRAEISVARQAFDHLNAQADVRVLDMQARRLAAHLRSQPKTEWRHVVLAAEKHVEAARRGEIIAVAAVEEQVPKWLVGRPAPDFLVSNGQTTSLRLSDRRGKPVIIAVIQSFQPLANEAIKTLRETHSSASVAATYVVVDQSSNGSIGADLHNQRSAGFMGLLSEDRFLTLPVCDAESLRGGPTPRFILIDERGIVRKIIDGYGPEVPTLLKQFVELRGCNDGK